MPWNGTAPPPHCFLVRGVFYGNDMSWTCRGIFGYGRKRDRKDAYSRNRVLKAEAAIKSPLQASRITYVHVGSYSVNDRLVTLYSSR